MVNISLVFRDELLWNRKMPYLKLKNVSILPPVFKKYRTNEKIVMELCFQYNFIMCKNYIGSFLNFIFA